MTPDDDPEAEATRERELLRLLVQEELKKSLPPPPDPPTHEHEWLTVPEVAALLRIGLKQTYVAIDRGEIPGVRRVGRTIRVRRKALLG